MEQIDPPLKLYDYMGGCKIDDYVYFLAGGLSVKEKFINNKACVYYSDKNKIKEIQPMKNSRYHFCTTFH